VSGEQYLKNILCREELNQRDAQNIENWRSKFEAILKGEFGSLSRVYYGGSYGKKTVNQSKYDLDIVVYLPDSCGLSLKEIFQQTSQVLARNRYYTDPKRVALTYRVDDRFHIDIVPGRAIDSDFVYANLYDRKKDTSLRTSIKKHIEAVKGIRQEVRILKLWNNQKKLNMKSFILEQLIRRAMDTVDGSSLDKNVIYIFDYIFKNIEEIRLVDPANSNNIVGEELDKTQRGQLTAHAKNALSASSWNEIVY
jgi:hypothetical protein